MKIKRLSVFFLAIVILLLTFQLQANALTSDETRHIDLGCGGGGDSYVESRVKDYYEGTLELKGITANTFKCAKTVGYKQIIADYKYEKSFDTGVTGEVLAHTSIYTNYDFDLDDVSIDIDEGKLIVSNTLYSDTDAWNIIYNRIGVIISGLSGLGILVCLFAFVLQIIRLGTAAESPSERGRAIRGLLWTGIATAGCSSVALIFSIAYSLL